ncbi:hypothetical protein OY671_011070, partial [Metschnikowia pulcherrima]
PGDQQWLHRPRRPGGHRGAQLRQLPVQAAGRRARQQRPAADPVRPDLPGQQPVRRPHRGHRPGPVELLHQHEYRGQQAGRSGRAPGLAGQGQQPDHPDPLGLPGNAEPAPGPEHADLDHRRPGQQLPDPHRRPEQPDFHRPRQGWRQSAQRPAGPARPGRVGTEPAR